MVGSAGLPSLRPDVERSVRGAVDALLRPLADGAALAGAARVTTRMPCELCTHNEVERRHKHVKSTLSRMTHYVHCIELTGRTSRTLAVGVAPCLCSVRPAVPVCARYRCSPMRCSLLLRSFLPTRPSATRPSAAARTPGS